MAAGHSREDTDVPEQMRVRLDKRQRLLDEGVDPYPVGFPRTATIAEPGPATPSWSRTPTPATGLGHRPGEAARPAGSVLRDAPGRHRRVQAMLTEDRAGAGGARRLERAVDLGDHSG